MAGNDQTFLVPLPSSVHQEVENIGLVDTICGTIFDSIASSIDNNRSSKIYKALIEPSQRRYPYQFTSGESRTFLNGN